MHKRFIAATLIAALSVSTTGMVVMGQDAEPQVESLTGTVVAVVDADGVTEFFLELADGTQIKLDMGPSWFWTDGGPLAALVGQEVTVGGHLSDGVPNENASDVAKSHASGEEAFDVHFINGEPLWTTGRPPWAGGPAVVGEIHPGFAGWSKGQANNEDEDTDEDVDVDEDVETDEVAADAEDGQAMAAARKGGPKVAGESHPGYKGWSRGQANKAANRAAAQAKRAEKAESGGTGGQAVAAAARERHGRP